MPIAAPADTAGEVRAAIAGRTFECAEDVAIVDGEFLRGVLPIEHLLAAAAAQPLESIMDADPPTIVDGL